MKEKIAECVHELFRDSENSMSNFEIQEELIFNLCEKYEDLLSEGCAPQAAFYKVISGIGDVNELIATANKGTFSDKAETSQRMYDEPQQQQYNSGFGNPPTEPFPRPIDKISDEDLLSPKSKKMFGLTTSIMWLAIVMFYFIISNIFSFVTSWIVFVVGAALNQVLLIMFYYYDMSISPHITSSPMLYMEVKKRIKGLVIGTFWVSVAALYFFISFTFTFELTWILFIIAAGLNQIILLFFSFNEDK